MYSEETELLALVPTGSSRPCPVAALNTSRFSQAASNSSAAACARAVCTPWPISTLGRKRRTVLSGRISNQAVGAALTPIGGPPDDSR